MRGGSCSLNRWSCGVKGSGNGEGPWAPNKPAMCFPPNGILFSPIWSTGCQNCDPLAVHYSSKNFTERFYDASSTAIGAVMQHISQAPHCAVSAALPFTVRAIGALMAMCRCSSFPVSSPGFSPSAMHKWACYVGNGWATVYRCHDSYSWWQEGEFTPTAAKPSQGIQAGMPGGGGEH